MEATDALLILALPVGAVGVAALARRYGIAPPLLLVVVGLVVSYLPGIPDYRLDPEFVLFVFLPPLLYAAAWSSSYVSMKDNVRPIALLSVGLVLFSTIMIGLVVHFAIPGMPLAAAFALGAIVAPPDAVAAISVARRLGLPRRKITILTGESLFNDATALTALRVAVAAAVGEGFSLLSGAWLFVLASVGGVLIGLAIGPPIHWLRQRLRDPVTENALALLVPFAAYLIAEALHVSGVLAVVVAGLYLGQRSTRVSSATRLQAAGLWNVIEFVLEALVFALIGLQLRPIMSGLAGRSWGSLVWYAVLIFGITVLTRFVWVFATSYLQRGVHKSWKWNVVVSWAGMRGVVSLAGAFSIPEVTKDGAPFPDRDLILFLTFCVVLGTLLIQGLSFPALIRRLGVASDRETFADNLSEAEAQYAAVQAALERLAEVTGDGPDQEEIAERLRAHAERRRLGAWERLGGGTGPEGEETPSTIQRRLRREMLTAERDTFVRLRDERRIDDEVLRRVLRELDLEEAMLARD